MENVILFVSSIHVSLTADTCHFPCSTSQIGWECNFSVPFSHRNNDHYFCDIDTIQLEDLLNNKQYFYTNYYNKKPLLINTSLSEWANESFWTKSSLLSKYGNTSFNIGESINIVMNDGNAMNNMTLTDYINDNNNFNYIFDRTIWNDLLLSNAINKDFILWNKTINNGGIFMYSSSNKSGSGTSFHKHGNTFVALMSGRKRFILYPPNIAPIGGYPPSLSTLDWFHKIYSYLDRNIDKNVMFDFNDIDNIYNQQKHLFLNNMQSLTSIKDILFKMESKIFYKYKPIECIHKIGQILFLPKLWWHSVLNLGDVIGISIQDDNEVKEESNDSNDVTEFRKNGGGSVGHYFVGNGYLYEGDIQNAIENFIKCILMDPMFINCYATLYQIYYHNGMLDEANKLLQISQIVNSDTQYFV